MPDKPGLQGTSLVLGVDTQIGLAIVRELGLAGVRVVAISHDPHAIGLASRQVWRRVVAGPPRGPAWIDALNALAAELGPCSVLAISEVNVQWLSRHGASLAPALKPSLPSAQALAIVLDKQQTLAAAQGLGLAVPRTEAPQSMAEVAALAPCFPFPAVLKWSDPNAVAPRLAAAGLELDKAQYVYSAAELHAAMRRYEAVGAWPLVQQYCVGQGLGQFFFMHEGQAVRRFQHLRVAEWPPEGGFSSVCDSLALGEHRALQERSIQLLQRIGWSGVAMVEYRLNAATGQALLMEINGRFWGSFPLAQHAGAGFALLSHCAAIGAPLPELPAPQAGLRCRMVATEIKRLKRLWLQPQLVRDRQFLIRPWAELGRFIGDYFKPVVSYYVWSARDPGPWFADLGNLLRKLALRR